MKNQSCTLESSPVEKAQRTPWTEDFSTEFQSAYSYDRPAYIFWSAFANGLIAAGYSKAAAEQWIRSKAARWSLDNELGKAIAQLAFDYAKSEKAQSHASIKECTKWAKQYQAVR